MHTVFSFEFLKIFHNSFFVKVKPKNNIVHITIIQIRTKQTLKIIFSDIQGMSKNSSYFLSLAHFLPMFRSSHRRCSVKKAVLKNVTNLTGQHLCWSLFLIKLSALKACNFIQETPTQELSCEHCEVFKSTYFEKHLLTAAAILPIITIIPLLSTIPQHS